MVIHGPCTQGCPLPSHNHAYRAAKNCNPHLCTRMPMHNRSQLAHQVGARRTATVSSNLPEGYARLRSLFNSSFNGTARMRQAHLCRRGGCIREGHLQPSRQHQPWKAAQAKWLRLRRSSASVQATTVAEAVLHWGGSANDALRVTRPPQRLAKNYMQKIKD